MYITKIECFNSRLYFYCVDNGINSLIVFVDLSRVPPVVAEGQSYTELPKELWDRTKQMERYKGTMSYKNYQFNAFYHYKRIELC